MAIISFLTTALALAATAVQAAPSSSTLDTRATEIFFEDQFTTLDQARWYCEYGNCPRMVNDMAKFELAANTRNANSSIILNNQQFTWGIFRFSLSLSPQPAARVFWGASLYNNGPNEDGSLYSQIDFGFYTDNTKFSNSQLFLESAVNGQRKTIDITANGINFYDGNPKTFQLEFNATRLSLSINDVYVAGHNEAAFLPSLPLTFSMGPRVLSDSTSLLTETWSQNVDYLLVNGGAPA
jgi:hypothetical protein